MNAELYNLFWFIFGTVAFLIAMYMNFDKHLRLRF